MIKNHFKIAWRNLYKRKSFSLINAAGLTLGITCAILIYSFVRFHLSFDSFHANTDRIYRIVTEYHEEDVNYSSAVPSPLGGILRNEYSLAEKVSRIISFPNQLISIPSAREQSKFLEERGVAFAEPDFFGIFNFPLVRGSDKSALSVPNKAIITERIAKKYFGRLDPIGHTIRIDNNLDFVIVGILKDLPRNTDFQQEIYLSYANLKDLKENSWLADDNTWTEIYKSTQCFILLRPQVAIEQVNEAFSAISKKYYNEKDAEIFQFNLQHISNMHFNPDLGGFIERQNLWILSMIGFFLIVNACLNFINLSTAQALKRAKEIGVRKVLGGIRRQLFWQFMIETAIITMFSMVLSIILTYFTMPLVNRIFTPHLEINFIYDGNLYFFLSLLLLVVVFLSGSYPGLVLAGFRPVLALKGNISQIHIGGLSLRKGLIITQFVISQLLIIGSIVIASQIRYAKRANMGFQKEAVLMLPIPERGDEKNQISIFKTKISQIAGVENVTLCYEAPAGPRFSGTYIRFGSRPDYEKFPISYMAADDQYVSTFELQIVEGRNLYPSDTIREILINETLAEKLNVTSKGDVIGENIHIYGKDATVVGVIKDFHNKSFHSAIDPLVITTSKHNYLNCAVKIRLATLKPAMRIIEKTWKETYPDYVYTYDFLEERIAQFYHLDNVIFRMIQTFTSIAISIGCLGLYGLVAFMILYKTREVGVRKVLGASTGGVLWFFVREYIKLLVFAFVVAAPLGWWVMHKWLENFVYRIDIGINIFVVSILISFLAIIIAVGYQSVKIAITNPVVCLRESKTE